MLEKVVNKLKKHPRTTKVIEGGIIGYLIISPTAMAISDFTHKFMNQDQLERMHSSLWISLTETFQFEFWPWSLSFILLTALFGWLIGNYITKTKESQEQHKSIFNNSADGIFIHDAQGNFLEINNIMNHRLGYSKDEFLSLNVSDIAPDGYKNKFLENIEHLKNKKQNSFETFHKRKDGSSFPVDVITTLIEFKGKQAFLATARDITEKKNAEKIIIESEEKYRSLNDSASDAIIVCNESGIIISWNKGAQNIFQYKASEIVGKLVEIIVPEKYKVAHAKGVQKFSNSKKSKHNGRILELEGLRKNGELFPLEISLSGWKTDSGYNYSAIIRDISNRKKIERELQERQLELENLVKEKDILLKEVHHRVKNNLQIISALLSLNQTDDQKVQDFVKESSARIRSMALLHEKIYQIDDINKFCFKAYVESLIVDLINSFADNKESIKYEVIVDQHIELRLKDAINLGLIITEIVTNSLKYAFEGMSDGKIQVSFTDNNGIVHLNIKDNGVGIDKIEKSTTTMGFLIIKSLSKQLGGELEVKNNNGTEYNLKYKNRKDKEIF